MVLAGDDAHIQLRHQLAQCGQARHQPVGGKAEVGGHRQHLALAPRPDFGRHLADAAQALAHRRNQLQPFRGERDATVLPLEQRRAQVILQQADALADRRLAGAQLPGGRRKAQVPHRGLKEHQALQRGESAHVFHKHDLYLHKK
ncbi:hypothetical protein D9M68_905960 [compost metagenome]